LAVTKQFYQIDSRCGEQTALHRVGQLDQPVTPWKIHDMGVRGMKELSSLGQRNIEVEGDLAEAADSLGEDHEMLLHVRVGRRANRIENADQVGFLIDNTDVAVTQVKRLGKRNYRRHLKRSFPWH
jgi:hypothetical protein